MRVEVVDMAMVTGTIMAMAIMIMDIHPGTDMVTGIQLI